MEIKCKFSHENMYELLEGLASALILRIIYQDDYMSISSENCRIGGIFTEEPNYEVLRDICDYITSKDYEYGRDWDASRLYNMVKDEIIMVSSHKYYVSCSFGGLQPALALLTFLATYSNIEICDVTFIHSKYEARGDVQYKKHVGVKLNKGNLVIDSFTNDHVFDDSSIPTLLDFNLNDIEIGKTYTFGNYHQNYGDSSEVEPIEWVVLNKNKKAVLLLSKKGLNVQLYNSTDENVTWETCYLREWLNHEFMNHAFNEEEQNLIQETTNKQTKNPKYNTEGGNPTVDKLFLLSVNEVKKYLKTSKEQKCKPSNYAIYQTNLTEGPSLITKDTCCWWLRTPGISQKGACYVLFEGSFSFTGYTTKKNLVCVRPALWVKV